MATRMRKCTGVKYDSQNFYLLVCYSSCWLRYDTGFIWVFIVPVLLILLVSVCLHTSAGLECSCFTPQVNSGFFVMTLVVVRRHSKKKEAGVLKSTW